MSKGSPNLTEDEVRRIGRILETLNRSTFDYLQIESGDLKLTLSKGPLPSAVPSATASPAASSPPQSAPHAEASAPKREAASATPGDGTVPIVSPMVGRFYLRPEPGASQFVQVGSEVSNDSTVGLIEVMKTFNAIHAGVSGVITEICTEDNGNVEYGQVLFRVRPKG